MREARTAVLIVFGSVPHSELVARLNELSEYLELGKVCDEDAVLLPWLPGNLEDVLDLIDGEGWEVYAVDAERSIRHYLATGEDGGYIGQLQGHARGSIVFETGAYRISRTV